ncbi:site-specific integrase [Deinococcus sp. QL22]|uniref:site-specific integrase n=1 Tax=Deinococcus sp. QL22 TaxID=2939437 RepID=UPI0020180740|nr:site-specific integrase [Deinococcus sp. QL22]UQN09488.1 site-specific integrase [Deinococcus sp. QL22]
MAAVTEGDTATLLDLLEAHFVRTHGHVSPETLRKYRLGARTWLSYAQANAVEVLHPEAEDTDLWVRAMETAGKSPASVGVLLAGARALYAALRWSRATKDTPFTDTKPKKDRRRPWDERQPYPEWCIKFSSLFAEELHDREPGRGSRSCSLMTCPLLQLHCVGFFIASPHCFAQGFGQRTSCPKYLTLSLA